MNMKKALEGLPRFMSHRTAREYLKKTYGKLIVMKGTRSNGHEKFYHYHFVTNVDRYLETDYLEGYEPFEITEKGRILTKVRGMDHGQENSRIK